MVEEQQFAYLISQEPQLRVSNSNILLNNLALVSNHLFTRRMMSEHHKTKTILF